MKYDQLVKEISKIPRRMKKLKRRDEFLIIFAEPSTERLSNLSRPQVHSRNEIQGERERRSQAVASL
jgi:hypothetical protein